MAHGLFTGGGAASIGRAASIAVCAGTFVLAGVAPSAASGPDSTAGAKMVAYAEGASGPDRDCLEKYRWRPRTQARECGGLALEASDEAVGAPNLVPPPAASEARTSTVLTSVTREDGTTAVMLDCPVCRYPWQPEKRRQCQALNPSAVTVTSNTGAVVTLDQCGLATTVFPDGSATEPGPAPDWAADSRAELDDLVGEPGEEPDPDPGSNPGGDDDDEPPPEPEPEPEPEGPPDIGIVQF